MKSMQKLLLVFLYLATVPGTFHAMDVNHGNKIVPKDETYKDVYFCEISAKRDLSTHSTPYMRNTVVKVLLFEKKYEQFQNSVARKVRDCHQVNNFDKESVGNIYLVDGIQREFDFFNLEYQENLSTREITYKNNEKKLNDLAELSKNNYISEAEAYKRDKDRYKSKNKLVEYIRRRKKNYRVPFIGSITRDKIITPKTIEVFVDDSFYIDSNVPNHWSREELQEKIGDYGFYGDLGGKITDFYKSGAGKNKIPPTKYYKVAVNKNGDEKVIEIGQEEFTKKKRFGKEKEIEPDLSEDEEFLRKDLMLVEVENNLVVDRNTDIKVVSLTNHDEKYQDEATRKIRNHHKEKHCDKESNGNVYLMNVKSIYKHNFIKDFEIEEIKSEEKPLVESLFDNDYIDESKLYKSNENNEVISRIKAIEEKGGKPFVAGVERDVSYEKQFGSQKFTYYNLDEKWNEEDYEDYEKYINEYCKGKTENRVRDSQKNSLILPRGYRKICYDNRCENQFDVVKLSEEEFNTLKRKRSENSEIDECAPPKKKKKME